MNSKNEPSYLNFHKLSSIMKPFLVKRAQWPESWKRIYFKGYPRFKRIKLDKSAWLNKKFDLVESILKRHSTRSAREDGEIDLKDLSFLLLGASICRVHNGNVFYESYRSYPSAGARYPLEVYLMVLHVKGLKKGVYHYHVRSHSLEYLWEIKKSEIRECFYGQDFINKSKVIFVISGVMTRTVVKYSARGYRFALIEAGHLAQNLSVLAQAINLQYCPVGGFIDRGVSKLFEFDENEELPLYTFVVL